MLLTHPGNLHFDMIRTNLVSVLYFVISDPNHLWIGEVQNVLEFIPLKSIRITKGIGMFLAESGCLDTSLTCSHTVLGCFEQL